MTKHVDRKSNEAIFRKCVDPRCDYCTTHPIISTKSWEYLREREFKWPNPVPSLNYPGHFKTFLEVDQLDSEYIEIGMCIMYTWS